MITVDDSQAALDAILADVRASRRAAGSRRFIGIYADGGIGDTMRIIAFAQAVRRRWPESRIHLVARDLGPDADGVPLIVNLMRGQNYIDGATFIPKLRWGLMVRTLYRQFDCFFEAGYCIRTYDWVDPEHQHQADLCLRPFERFAARFPASSEGIESLGMTQWEIQAATSGLNVSEDDLNIQAVPLTDRELPDRFVALHNMAGGMALAKCAPLSTMAEIAALLDVAGFTPVQLGAADDPAIRNCVDFRGLTINQSAWVIGRAKLLIDIEGGLGYIARAVGTRRACFFGPTPHAVFRFEGDLPLCTGQCAPCWHHAPRWAVNCHKQFPTCLNIPTDAGAIVRFLLPAIQEPEETAE
jgi:ADP-heptose:LPS heptosyltransferase